jgi:hypothetical protein
VFVKSLTMKPTSVVIALLIVASFVSCSKEDDLAPSKLNHQGEKWNISSVEYTIVDQDFSNPANLVQTGTANDAGAFYFNGSQGSFDIVINNSREEDYFGYTMDGSSVTIITVEQSVSPSFFSQSIIAFSGDKSENTMTISGTFTRQSGLTQYVFTGDFVLTRD